jgi:osmoprotectant transport system permease protein
MPLAAPATGPVQLLAATLAYVQAHAAELMEAAVRHLALSAAALLLAVALCMPLGVYIARRSEVAEPVIGVFSALRVVPSLALLFLVVPILGFNAGSALLALAVLACPLILLNTVAGFRGLDPAVREAAQGMGMDDRQLLRHVELPLASPVLLSGVRLAALEVVASATLAAWIGVGGLGAFVQRGFAVGRSEIVLAGAVPIALLAVTVELGFHLLQRRLPATEQSVDSRHERGAKQP